ncbi:hypothetical protein JK628_11915 [Shewanella sp. KX20019]|nr:hypothetical protein JK628_11915 [Shewanella sp. KX20019]
MFNQMSKMFIVVATFVVFPPNLYAEEASNPNYDADRAANAGADQYGMKHYVMAFLKRGPNRDRTEEEAKALQAAHMENIGRLADEGKLVLAGPFIGDGEVRGIYIFDVTSVEEARALTATDPAIEAGSLIMELQPWYGTAALTEVNKLHALMAETLM